VTDAENLVHILVAVALTYALGFERDLRGSPIGDRVFALIGVAAGLVGVFSVEGAPTALQGVLTGIGFIGAAVVFRQDLGRVQQVRGLTTAAALFAAVTIGAAAGEGRLLLATVSTAIALLVLELRYIRGLMLLDGRRWTSRFRNDELPPRPLAGEGEDPHQDASDQ
jgi:putative Mg2+ transporter-C (MgtC) family protein